MHSEGRPNQRQNLVGRLSSGFEVKQTGVLQECAVEKRKGPSWPGHPPPVAGETDDSGTIPDL